MEVGAARELLVLLGSFVASAFALIRLSLGQQRAIFERFMGFLERTVERLEAANERFSSAVQSVGEGLRENTQVLGRLSERAGVRFAGEEGN